MRLILNRDDLVKILQEDEEIRDLIRKLALGQPEEGEAHEVPESLKESEVPKAPMEASLSPKKQELRKELEATRKDRDYWQQEASQAATERDDAVRDCQGALNERDQALDQRNQAVQERDEAVREKNGALRAMAEAEQQREQAVLAMKDADRKIDEARRIVSGLQSERDFLQERLDEAKAGIGALTADLDRVKAEREALKIPCSRQNRHWLSALTKAGSFMKHTKNWTTILKTSWTASWPDQDLKPSSSACLRTGRCRPCGT